MTPEEHCRQAHIRLGGVEQVQQVARDRIGCHGWRYLGVICDMRTYLLRIGGIAAVAMLVNGNRHWPQAVSYSPYFTPFCCAPLAVSAPGSPSVALYGQDVSHPQYVAPGDFYDWQNARNRV